MPILPMGASLSQKAVQRAYSFTLEANRARQIARIENVPPPMVPVLQEIGFHSIHKETEYLYETAALVQLKGDRYKSKRAAYNHLIRNYPTAELQPYRSTHLAECLALYKLWQQQRQERSNDEVYRAMLEDSWHAHHTALIHYEKLGLIGRVVLIGGVVKGYTFGYPLNSEIFCILFEVTHLRIRGLAQFIFREFCREQAAYRWINTMDDSGLENLKHVKLSYRPAKQLPSYNLFRP